MNLLLHLKLLLQLEGSSLILEDALVQVASAVVLSGNGSVVHLPSILHNIILLVSKHLNILIGTIILLLVVWQSTALTVLWIELLVLELLLATWSLTGLVLTPVLLFLLFVLLLSLLHFLLTLNCLPVDSIADWLAAAAKYWERIQPRVHPENLLPVLL